MATRAEARRRKILENSEERLKRLTGRLGSDTNVELKKRYDEDNMYDGESKILPEKAKSKDMTEKPVYENEMARISPEKPIATGDPPESLEIEKAEKVKGEGHMQQTGPCNTSPTTNSARIVRNRLSQPSDRSNTTQSESSAGESKTEKDTDKSAALIQQIQITRLACSVAAAVLCRWILPTILGYVVLQSSAILFIALEAALFTHQKQVLQVVVLPHKSNMMAAALVLCGIKPELITTYNRIMGIASTVFEDLMVFYFTFITCHLLAS